MKINPWILVILLLSFAGVAFVYPGLPAEIPTHWNMQGQITDTSSRAFVLFLAMVPVGIYLMMIFLPKIDPKRSSYILHKKAYEITRVSVSLLLSAAVWISILSAKGMEMNVGLIVSMMSGVMFIVMGNYMGQIRQNYFFGIKTPWTLANETVWRKTHRVGGYCFMLMGAGIMLLNLFRNSLPSWSMILVILTGAGIPVVYSYFAYQVEERRKGIEEAKR